MGDIEAQYTTSKNTLPERVVEDMREACKRAFDLLQTGKSKGKSEEELRMSIKKELLLVAGYTQGNFQATCGYYGFSQTAIQNITPANS